jgi:hypothetical protein
MANLKTLLLTYKPNKIECKECGIQLKDYRSKLCRPCWSIVYAENPNKAFGNRNVNWKGNKVSYRALHRWIENHKPKPLFCEICKKKPPKQLANISGRYKRNIKDYQWLCVKCHVIKDGTINNLIPNNRKKDNQLNNTGGD